MGLPAEIGSSLLLFFLVFGMSATVELKRLKKQLRNRAALCAGLALQFVILPFCGFLVVKILNPPPVMGITLLVVTSSPGGSYSNWWCSLFNAELSLSITMTAISTLLSTVMLPANLFLYTRWTYSGDVVQSVDWYALYVGLVVVIGGIACGLVSSQWTKMNENIDVAKFHRRANLLGNIAGVALITLSVTVSSTGQNSALWDQGPAFYVGVALPFILGLCVAILLTSKMGLEKPERVAVCVEASFQNTGIATSVAITMFSANEEALATALGVPLYYGMVEAVGLAIFCIVCWKIGYTKAPPDENLCVVIYNSYEVEEQEVEEAEIAIEVVLGSPDDSSDNNKDSSPNDLIFEQTDDGAYVVDEDSLHKLQKKKKNASSPSLSKNNQELPTTPVTSSDENDDNGEGDAGDSGGPQQQQQQDNNNNDDMEQPSSSGGQQQQQPGGGGGITRTIAKIKARATGYRRPDVAIHQRRIQSSADDPSEDFSIPRSSTKPVEVGSSNKQTQSSSSSKKSYEQIPTVTSSSPSPEQNKTISSLPADGKQID